MELRDFENEARSVFEEIPEMYREGIDGLTVSHDAPAHPELPGVYTMGECVTEEHLSDFGSAETTRSVIVLYWGSFRAVSLENEEFDWAHEIWDTVTHELRHHLESLAGDAALEGVDYAVDESFRRLDGQPFDPWYYQHGEEVEAGVFRVEDKWYVEQAWSQAEYDRAAALDFEWAGRRYDLPKPKELGDVHFILVRGLGETEPIEIVLVRERSWWEDVRRVVGTSRATVHESEVDAELTESEE